MLSGSERKGAAHIRSLEHKDALSAPRAHAPKGGRLKAVVCERELLADSCVSLLAADP